MDDAAARCGPPPTSVSPQALFLRQPLVLAGKGLPPPSSLLRTQHTGSVLCCQLTLHYKPRALRNVEARLQVPGARDSVRNG